MAKSASEYHHGDMDIHAQAATFRGFVRFTKWGSLALAVAVLALAMWFCTDTGFLPGAIAGVLVAVIGVAVLREKPGGGAH